MAAMVVPETLAAVITSVCSQIPDETLRSSIAGRLQHEWDEPPVIGVELLLHRHVSPEKLRELLFSPSDDDDSIGVYPKIIAALSKTLPAAHPARPAQSAFLALLFLHHARNWRLAVGFIRCGGLQALASLLRAHNLFVRTQAIETLLQLTSHEGINWFDPPTGEEERRLYSLMLSLGATGGQASTEIADEDDADWGKGDASTVSGRLSMRRGFLSALALNWDCGAPGASQNSLQILAFWLSWARKLYTEDERLYLSRALLDRLKEWMERPVGENAVPDIVPLDSDGVGVGLNNGLPPAAKAVAAMTTAIKQVYSTAEESVLARQLWEDFSRFGCAEEQGCKEAASQQSVAGLSDSATSLAESCRTVHTQDAALGGLAQEPANAHALDAGKEVITVPTIAPETDPMSTATACKEQGNTLFKSGQWEAACAAYERGIHSLEAVRAQHGADGGLWATLHANRAAAHLRAAGYGADLIPSHAFLRDTRRALETDAEQTHAQTKLDPSRAPAASTPISHLLRALSDCEAAQAASQGGHAKAGLRRAQALAGLHRFSQSAAAARSCLGMDMSVTGDASAVASLSRFLDHVTPLQAADWAGSESTAASCGPAVAHVGAPPNSGDLEAEILASLLGSLDAGSSASINPEVMGLDEQGDGDALWAELQTGAPPALPKRAALPAPGIAASASGNASHLGAPAAPWTLDDIISGTIRGNASAGAANKGRKAAGGTSSYLRNLM